MCILHLELENPLYMYTLKTVGSVLFSFIFYACVLLAALLTAYYSGHREKNKQKKKKKRKKFSYLSAVFVL